jgi:hypothetical protein
VDTKDHPRETSPFDNVLPFPAIAERRGKSVPAMLRTRTPPIAPSCINDDKWLSRQSGLQSELSGLSASEKAVPIETTAVTPTTSTFYFSFLYPSGQEDGLSNHLLNFTNN